MSLSVLEVYESSWNDEENSTRARDCKRSVESLHKLLQRGQKLAKDSRREELQEYVSRLLGYYAVLHWEPWRRAEDRHGSHAEELKLSKAEQCFAKCLKACPALVHEMGEEMDESTITAVEWMALERISRVGRARFEFWRTVCGEEKKVQELELLSLLSKVDLLLIKADPCVQHVVELFQFYSDISARCRQKILRYWVPGIFRPLLSVRLSLPPPLSLSRASPFLASTILPPLPHRFLPAQS